MSIVLVTGSAGLIGSEAARFFAGKGFQILGIDNDMRGELFGPEASTAWNRRQLEEELSNYRHFSADIRDQAAMTRIFEEYGSDIALVIHAAAQPSHDWAVKDPIKDFSINANGTLVLLECTRRHCPRATFIFTSTNKVYGDRPNELPLVEHAERWELDPTHAYFEHGIDEGMSIDQSKHSLFGASKVAADILVQEYGRYFGMNTACFRGGCLTGPGHSGTALHGFLAYMMKCAITGQPYTVLGYKGKQVRDNIHSRDIVSMFWCFFQGPRSGEVYNAGGGRFSNCSMLEAIRMCEEITGRKMNYSYSDANRIGDHIWWISDTRKFRAQFPDWRQSYTVRDILLEIFEAQTGRFADQKSLARSAN
jgi:CDP-paratose 2-epimerase